MNPQDYRRAVECFSQIEALDSSARASRLAEIRAQDPELADSVEAMWNASNAKGTLLDTPPAECRELRALLHLGVDTNVPDRIGEFRVLHRLAVGGMAEVYLAQQQRPLRLVAIKVLRPLFALGEARAQFDREIELLGRLNHTGIVGVVLAGECDLGEGSQPYLVMEYVDGVPINDFVRVGKSTLAARVALVADAAEAVASAHAAGVLHLDLKPANVLVDRHGRVRVLDFGVGRLLHDPRRAGSSSTSHTGVTLQYASPEQRKGQLDRVGPASDLYSLSLLTLEVVTDRPPSALFHDELAGFDAALTQIMNQSSLGEEVAAILRPALELDPRRRLDSASDLSH